MDNIRTIIVTGASSGIGFDACRYLSGKGFYVIGTVRTQEDKIRLERKFPDHFEAFVMDVVKDDDIANLQRYLKHKLAKSGLFGLINNAGIAKGGPLMHVTNAEFDIQMHTNLTSVFRITNALLPLMGADKNVPLPPGRIINISSVSGLISTPMLGPYCVSKHALESMSDVYRRELAVYGIKVILIEPGPIKTAIWEKSVPGSNPYEETDFGRVYNSFKKQVEKTAANALPVELVSKLIYKVLVQSSPANRTIISRSKGSTFLISRFLPSKILDRIFIGQLRKQMKE